MQRQQQHLFSSCFKRYAQALVQRSREDSIPINTPGKYWVAYANDTFSAIDTFIVRNTFISPLNTNVTICKGSNYLYQLPQADTIKYIWQNGETGNTFNITKDGKYWLKVITPGCIYNDTIFVNYHRPLDTLVVDSQVCVANGYTIDLDSIGGQIIWQDGTIKSKYFIRYAGDYNVKVHNQCGVYERTFSFEEADCSCEVHIPNAFTPNADFINENFQLFSSCDIEEFNLKIFSRWGELIFETDSIDNSWDAKFKGKLCSDGIYFYKLSAKFISAQHIYKNGTLQISY